MMLKANNLRVKSVNLRYLDEKTKATTMYNEHSDNSNNKNNNNNESYF